MHFFPKQVFPLAFLFFLSSSVFAQEDYVFKNEKDGVKVYYKKTDDVHDVKLTTSFQSSASALVKLFSEVSKFPTWGYKISESKLLKKVSATEIYYYSVIDFPWPMSDRDVIMHSTLSQDPKTGIVTSLSEAVPDYLPEKEGLVRMTIADTKWIIHKASGGNINVEYYIHSHPGGNIPAWLVNMAIDVGPRETIKAMRDILQEPEYKSARLAHIKE